MKCARLTVALAAALAGMAAGMPFKAGVAPACSNVVGATKDGAKCSQLRAGMCQQAEACSDLFETYVDQLAALRKEAANLRALLPTASRYEGANGGTISVGGGTVANTLVQVTSFPSASSDAAGQGVDMVEVFFTVTAQVDPKALLSWQALTNGQYLPGGNFEEGKGRVRCGVELGYGGGSSAANQQPSLSTTNGFVAYGKADVTGITLESDQLPVVNNFDSTRNLWPLGQYSCAFLVQRA